MTKSAKPDTWMPLFIGDYIGGTSRLTTEQHGCYILLIMDYWRNGPPPVDDAVLCQIVKLDRRTWLKHKPAVMGHFEEQDGAWRHDRIERELAAAQARAEKAAERAAAAAEARWSKDRARERQSASLADATSNAPSMPEAVLDECPSPSSAPVRVSEAKASSSARADKAGPRVVWDDTFSAAWTAYPHFPGRSASRAKCWPVWREQARLCGGPEKLLEAVKRFARMDKGHKTDAGAKAFERWLRDGRWEHWLEGDALPGPVSVFPDPEIRYAVELAKDEAWAASWLDPCAWDAERRTIIPRTNFAAAKLKQEVGDVFRGLGAFIEERAAA